MTLTTAYLFQHTATRRWLALNDNYHRHTQLVSTHSHPKVAGWCKMGNDRRYGRFNTQPPEGGWSFKLCEGRRLILFQHTATRRWLGTVRAAAEAFAAVSTHSHPKVAGPIFLRSLTLRFFRFNTQPPEGGWLKVSVYCWYQICFNTQPPEGGWP